MTSDFKDLTGIDEAVAVIRSADVVAMPIGPGQPPALLQAMGRRTDWTDLRIYGALLTVLSDVFNHPNVHYLSGFFGPVERLLRDAGSNLGFAPVDFRGFRPMLDRLRPRVMITAASPPDPDGWCSLSLHAGATFDELHAAGADADRVLIVEVSPRFPRTRGLPPDHRHALHVSEIDVLVQSAAEPVAVDDPAPSDVHRSIAEHASRYIPDGATLQTGIGAVPSIVAGLLADGDGGDYGIHTEVFTGGLMRLHLAGKVSNNKGRFDGVSVTTFASGGRDLYDWLDDNPEVAFLPADIVNAPEVIGHNRNAVTVNGAMAIDIHGQVVADTIDGRQYSGIGGHQDFVSGPGLSLDARSLLCLPSTFRAGGEIRSRIVPWFGPGVIITTPRHHVDVVVTEYGVAELQGRTTRQRGAALAAIAHPEFRDELLAAAERASSGRSPVG